VRTHSVKRIVLGLQERKAENWRLLWRGMVQPKAKTAIQLRRPLELGAGQEQGILMHSRNDRVCYSSRMASVEDAVLCLKPWFATSSAVSFFSRSPPFFFCISNIYPSIHLDSAA